MNTKEKIEVMQAFVDGKEIEYRDSDIWLPTTDPIWDWDTCDYRIKKTPKYIVLAACCDKTDFEIVECVEIKALEDALSLVRRLQNQILNTNLTGLLEDQVDTLHALKALVNGE